MLDFCHWSNFYGKVGLSLRSCANNVLHDMLFNCCSKVALVKPYTDAASNLLAIDLQLDIQIACDSLQQKFQHAEYLTCDPLISQPIQIVFTVILKIS